MHDGNWGLWGMHAFWWLLWLAVVVALFAAFVPLSHRRRRETPLELLQHRYAAGEISTEEYEERKARLERDA